VSDHLCTWLYNFRDTAVPYTSEIRINTSWIYRRCTYPRISVCFVEFHLKFPNFYRDQILGKNSTTIKNRFHVHCLRADRSSQREFHISMLRIFSIVLPKTVSFISLYKFFSNSLFARVLKFVLSWMYLWSHGDCVNCNMRWIFVMRRLWRVTSMRELPLLYFS